MSDATADTDTWTTWSHEVTTPSSAVRLGHANGTTTEIPYSAINQLTLFAYANPREPYAEKAIQNSLVILVCVGLAMLYPSGLIVAGVFGVLSGVLGAVNIYTYVTLDQDTGRIKARIDCSQDQYTLNGRATSAGVAVIDTVVDNCDDRDIRVRAGGRCWTEAREQLRQRH